MNIIDKVGQMLMVGFHGLEAPDYILEWLKEGKVGGVILFARNVESPKQVADLCQSLHDVAKYPILISIDQEGGAVARLREGFSQSRGAMALSATANTAPLGFAALHYRRTPAFRYHGIVKVACVVCHNTSFF